MAIGKKFAVSIMDNGPLSFRWRHYSFEKNKPSKPVENENDAIYLRNAGLYVRELAGPERPPHALAPKASAQVVLEEEFDEDLPEDEPEAVEPEVTSTSALDSAVPPPKKKPSFPPKKPGPKPNHGRI